METGEARDVCPSAVGSAMNDVDGDGANNESSFGGTMAAADSLDLMARWVLADDVGETFGRNGDGDGEGGVLGRFPGVCGVKGAATG